MQVLKDDILTSFCTQYSFGLFHHSRHTPAMPSLAPTINCGAQKQTLAGAYEHDLGKNEKGGSKAAFP
jgi:hypothetical protein